MTGEVEVSLVMCVWKPRADWLAAAALSALEDESALELVIVDDGNDVPVSKILEVDDPRIRHVRIPHGGQLAARDAGIAAARGRYLRFLDDDDVVVAGSTSQLLRMTAGRRDAIAYGAVTVCNDELQPLWTISSSLQGDVVVPCLLGDFLVRHVAMAFPRGVVDLAGPWSTGLAVSADWDFVLRALEHAIVIGTTEPALLYRRHGTSASGRADIESGERARNEIIRRYLERNPQMKDSPVERAAWAAMWSDRAAAYAAAGQRRQAVSRLWRLARVAPFEAARQSINATRLAVGQMRSGGSTWRGWG